MLPGREMRAAVTPADYFGANSADWSSLGRECELQKQTRGCPAMGSPLFLSIPVKGPLLLLHRLPEGHQDLAKDLLAIFVGMHDITVELVRVDA